MIIGELEIAQGKNVATNYYYFTSIRTSIDIFDAISCDMGGGGGGGGGEHCKFYS